MSSASGDVLLIAAAFVWVAGWVAASIWWRRRHGKPIFPRRPADAIYCTTGGSTRFASNCLMVAVTPTDLMVTPTFPFNLGFGAEIYRLEEQTPLSSIRSAQKQRGWLNVIVEIERPDGTVRRRELGLRSPDLFLAAVRGEASPVRE